MVLLPLQRRAASDRQARELVDEVFRVEAACLAANEPNFRDLEPYSAEVAVARKPC